MPNIYQNSELLANQLNNQWVRPNIDSVEIPQDILDSLNQNFPLREYQKFSFCSFVYYLKSKQDKEPTHLLFNMATGSGKTLLMAAFILYLYKKGYRNFLFFSTSNPIIEKTKDNFANFGSPKYLFNSSIKLDDKLVNIREVSNFDYVNVNDINIKFTTIQKLHLDLKTPRENSITLNDFQKNKIVLIGDEAHHFTQGGRNNNGELPLEYDDNHWENTIDKILKQNIDHILLEFSATIDWNDEVIYRKYIDKCISLYGLKEFRKDGYSKEIKLFQYDEEIKKEDLMLQAIILNQFKQDIALENHIELKPVILFKANKTIAESKDNFKDFCSLIQNLDANFIEGLYGNIQKIKSSDCDLDDSFEYNDINYLKMAFEYYSKKDSTFNVLVQKLKMNFDEKYCLNVNEYAFDGKKQSQKSFEKDKLKDTNKQENLLNTLESSNNPIRAIFAVNKLNEGWDVLNLFDIVRLYNTRDAHGNNAGATTVAEAQLIGRGARYFPFSNGEDDKFKRKFDQRENEPLRLLEILHYHSIRNNRYISELRNELINIGAKDPRTEKVTKTIKLKFLDDEKQLNLFNQGIIYVNSRQKKNYSNGKVWNDISLVKGKIFEYKINTGATYEEKVFRDGTLSNTREVELQEKTVSISSISKNVKLSALLDDEFYSFYQLKEIFPEIDSVDDFISNYIDSLQIKFRGLKYDLNDISLENQFDALKKLLLELKREISPNITPYEGSEKFEAKMFGECFVSEKAMNFAYNNSRLNNEFGMRDFLSQKDWYVYDNLYGTSEEENFLKWFDGFYNELSKSYTDIKLLRNEQFFKIYNFKDGAPFEPDFVLTMKDLNNNQLNYQFFMEPKGDHIKEHDKWKEEFLEKIKDMFKDNFIEFNKSKKFKIIGLKFYNSQIEQEFTKQFKESLK